MRCESSILSASVVHLPSRANTGLHQKNPGLKTVDFALADGILLVPVYVGTLK
jgi:hypothetical protein